MARLRKKYRKDANGRKVVQTFIGEFYDASRHPKRKRVSLGTRDEQAARQALGAQLPIIYERRESVWIPVH